MRQASVRRRERAFVLEGAKVLTEALDAGAPVESVYVSEGYRPSVVDRAVAAGARDHTLGEGVMERVAGTVTPQPVIAVAPFLDVPLDRLREATFVVVCVEVSDPGNLGSVLRSAEAAGVDGVVCCEGCVDVTNPKVVRASAGSIFHVQVVAGGEPVEVLDRLGAWGLRRWAAGARGGVDPAAADLAAPLALVLGNEAHGLPAGVETVVDAHVTIPMAGRGESLNVSAAAAVLCFEAARQRQRAGDSRGGG